MRVQAAVVSVVVGTIVLGFKYLAYQLTGSTAILSDALESIINVIAALFALGGLIVAGWPADRTHPYGHGKVEFLSAGFTGLGLDLNRRLTRCSDDVQMDVTPAP